MIRQLFNSRQPSHSCSFIFPQVDASKMDYGDIYWPGFCGDDSQYQAFWSTNLTLDTNKPVLTACFQHTVLLWVPCAWLWVSSIFYLPFLLKRNSVHSLCTFSRLNAAKMFLAIVLVVLSLLELIEVLARLTHTQTTTQVIPGEIVAAIIKTCTLMLAMWLTRLLYIKGLHTSGILFSFWLLLTITSSLQLYSMETVLGLEWAEEKERDLLHYAFIIYVVAVVVMFLSNVVADQSALRSTQAKGRPRTDEKTPLLPEESSVQKLSKEHKNPFDEISFLSRILFFWFGEIVYKGYKRTLTYDDLWDIREDDSSVVIYNKFETYWQKEKKTALEIGSEPSLLKAFVKTISSRMLAGGFCLFMYQAMTIFNPLLMNLLIDFIGSSNPYTWQGYCLAVLMFCCTLMGSLLLHNSSFFTYQCGMHLKSAVITSVYRKSLKLSNLARKKTTVGEIVNLMSVDAQKVNDSQMFSHFLWVTPLAAIANMVILYQKLGAAAFVSLAFYLMILPINSIVVARLVTHFQSIQMKLKDLRIKLMSQILTGIKVLKLYAWEKYFEEKIVGIRDEEIVTLRIAALISAASNTLSISTNFMVALLSFLAYIYISPDNVLTPDIAFLSIAIFQNLGSLLAYIPLGTISIVNAWVSFKRIRHFLLLPEIDPGNVQNRPEGCAISIEEGCFSWEEEDRITLKGINMRVPVGSLVAVVGTVGAGKSSLIQAVLGEMEVITGRVNVQGSVAYVPQQAWIQNMSLQDNILFEKAYRSKKYEKAISACALGPDLQILPGGDQTEIGERGINLSGGQKQRVSVARAVYQNADIYLLDDPLSAVDSHVGKHIFDNVIGPYGVLSEKTRLLVTNTLTYLHLVDNIIVLDNGEISEVGSFIELVEKDGNFADFLKQFNSNKVEESIEDEILEDGLSPTPIRKLDMVEAVLSALSAASSADDSSSTITEKRLRRRRNKKNKEPVIHVGPVLQNQEKKLVATEGVEEGSVKASVAIAYIKAVTSFWMAMTMLGLLCNIGGTVGNNIWLSLWSNDQTLYVNGTAPDNIGERLGVYAALGFVQMLGGLVYTIAIALGTNQAAQTLHSDLLTNNLRSPMAFFDTTPLGRILNRYSKDVDTCDSDLRNYIQTLLQTLATIIAVFTIVIYSTPIFVAVLIPLCIIYTVLQRIYVKTARQIKRIDSVRRSPIYSFFSETLSGVASIRAYREEERFITHSDKLLDDSQKIWFSVFTSNRWIGVCAELLGDTIVLFTAIFAVLQRNTLDAGTVGLSVSYSLQVSFQIVMAVRFSCELETYIVAVERIKEYTETPPEAPWIEEHRPALDWPEDGVVEFKNYQTRYRPGLDLVLKGVTCHIKPGEMVGIVGRTGAGKSSMTLALFRIMEAAGGSIYIDGENIADIGLHDLRSRLTIIPQDPVLFSGSLRFNIDPAEQHTDSAIMNSLHLAHLKDFVSTLPHGLDFEAGEDGTNLSVGQRQLVCLARALLRKTKILVMDEATAAVDLETDELIQLTIRREFKACTVLTIAHRLNTIMDYDRVMVMDAGLVREFDTPNLLLENRSSVFYGMAFDAGLV